MYNYRWASRNMSSKETFMKLHWGFHGAVAITMYHSDRRHDWVYCCPGMRPGTRISCPSGPTISFIRYSDVQTLSNEWDAVVLSTRCISGKCPTAKNVPSNVIRTLVPLDTHLKGSHSSMFSHYDLAFSPFSGKSHVLDPHLNQVFLDDVFAPLRIPFKKRNTEFPVAAIIYDCGGNVHSYYKEVLSALTDHSIVKTFGSCSHDKLSPLDEDLLKNYKFILAVENKICTDYITEKLARAYRLQMIPIVLDVPVGGSNSSYVPDYAKFVPPKSLINLANFSSLRDAANYIKKVAGDEKLWMKYMSHRNWYSQMQKWKSHYDDIIGLPVCRLAERALNMSTSSRKTREKVASTPGCITNSSLIWRFTEDEANISVDSSKLNVTVI